MRKTRPLGSAYTLREPIGRGSMGQLWRATTRVGKESVAVKVLRSELTTDPEMVARFLQERTILTSLHHPNLVRVRDLVAEGDTLAIVMDLVDGPDLRRHLARTGPLPPAAAVAIVIQVLDALAAAHAAGVIHRDLKPENVLLDLSDPRSPSVRVTDFGIARLTSGPGLTRVTGIIGTPEYMAPELAEHGSSTAATDLYAAGIVLYETLCGHTPFSGGHPFAILRQQVEEPPPPLPGLYRPLWDVVASLLAKDPHQRPESAIAAARRLRELKASLVRLPALAPAGTGVPEVAGAGAAPLSPPVAGRPDPTLVVPAARPDAASEPEGPARPAAAHEAPNAGGATGTALPAGGAIEAIGRSAARTLPGRPWVADAPNLDRPAPPPDPGATLAGRGRPAWAADLEAPPDPAAILPGAIPPGPVAPGPILPGAIPPGPIAPGSILPGPAGPADPGATMVPASAPAAPPAPAARAAADPPPPPGPPAAPAWQAPPRFVPAAPAAARPRRAAPAPSSRWRWIAAGVGVAVVLAAGGFTVPRLLGSTPAAATHVGGALGIVSYRFAPVTGANGLTAERSWTLSGGSGPTLRSVLHVSNSTDAAVTGSVDEVIPKTIAPSVSALRFSPAPDMVVTPDPVIRYSLTALAPAASADLTYEATVSPQGSRPDWLRARVADLDAAQNAYQDQVRGSSLSSISVTPATLRLVRGQTATLLVAGALADGSAASADELSGAAWSTSNRAVATVSSGAVLAVGTGSATISVQVGTLHAAAAVQVTPTHTPTPRPSPTPRPTAAAPTATGPVALDGGRWDTSFEDGGADGWVGAANTSVLAIAQPGLAHTGNDFIAAYAQVNGTPVTGGEIVRVLPVTPQMGRTYTFSIWIETGATQVFTGGIWIDTGNAAGVVQYAMRQFNQSTTWQQISMSLTVSHPGTTALGLAITMNTAATLFLDDETVTVS